MSLQNMVGSCIKKLTFDFPYEVEDYSKNLYYENYHSHKDFSNCLMPDSGELIDNYILRTQYLNGKCLFSGEHGTQGNQFFVYESAENSGLKYRHSSEVYWVKDRHLQDKTNSHMVIVATGPEGRRSLNYILSMANIDGYYYRPRIDLDLLLSVPSDQFIVTSACIAGWNYDDASDIWLKIHEHFGDNFFFEVQANNTDKQKYVNEDILRLSEKHGIQIIAGTDSHYIGNEGQTKRDQILKYKKVEYPEEAGWYMDYPDVYDLIKRFGEQGVLNQEQVLTSIMNTNVFSSNKFEEITFDRKFKIPTVYPNRTYEEKVKIYHNELNKAYKKETFKSKEKADGIRYEAKHVVESGVVDYFLTTKAIIDEAVNNFGGVLTTTSRGSAASFVTNKLLGITTVDRYTSEIPIYPERFLTKERVLAGQMPDADLNIAEQEPFVKASRKLLGEHGCYPLMAVEKLKPKSAWKLYAGANNVSPSTADKISKYIDEYDKKVKHAAEDEKDDILVEDFIPEEYLDIFNKSRDYRSITINLKVHACGHLIFNGDIRKEIGLISAVSESSGKRTICAAVEGKYLDDFGYVKEDFLIVDAVSLTDEFFKSINERVPSFDELKTMVMNNEKTWDVYKNGITCCVNQCEKESTTGKVKKYKPHTIAELAAFIAGIRPGFSSLLSTFLERRDYSTGEIKIDELLNDTSHFAIYQESLMKILSFLGLQMDETYGVIKNISKKKYLQHPEKLKELKDRLTEGWKKQIGNTDNFNTVWKVIESSAAYAFNSPHAYSMAGDSLYQAWFKSNHTKEFYEVAIRHYQRKNNKDKIDALIKEAVKFYGYKIGEYKFGNDNRIANISDGVIYPNMSSLKGFGEGTVNELYEAGLKSYSSFIEVLTELYSRSINKPLIANLIKIDYFSEFGAPSKLLKVMDYYNLLFGKKEIFKEKAIENGIPIELLKEYGHETDKKFNKVDMNMVLSKMIDSIEYHDMTMKEHILAELEVLDMVTYKNPDADKRLYCVLDIEIKKTLIKMKLYEIWSGKTRDIKMWSSKYKYPISKNDFIYLLKTEKKNVREPNGDINPFTGKKIYVDVPNKYERWLLAYEVDNEETLY